MKKKFWHDGINFKCHQCGNCCTQPGGSVTASEAGFKKIAHFLKIILPEFLNRYAFNHKGYVSIKSEPNGPCIFYKDGCMIYEVRPSQCGTFPFWPEILKSQVRLNNMQEMCAGINIGQLWTKEEISKEIKKQKIELMTWPEKD